MKVQLKYILKTLLCVALLYVVSVDVHAQNQGDCQDIFIRAFNDFRKPTGVGYLLSYTIETALVSDQVSSEGVEIRVKGDRTYMKSGNSQVYKDDKATVLIDHARKLIFITKVADESFTAARVGQMAIMQDSLLNGEMIPVCDVQEAGENKVTRLTLDSNNKTVASMGLKELSYWISNDSEQLRKVNAVYRAGHPQLKSIQVEFGEYNKQYTGEVFSGSALSKVFKSEGKVHEAYASYRVVNNLTS